jgi:hypothetical protein
MPERITHLGDLTADPKNARRHTPRNVGAIETALREVGAARSIVIDEDGVVLAGNATIEAAAQMGIERVQVVDADGNTLIAVRRTGLTPAQKTRLALFDNRAAELAEWDTDVLAGLVEGGTDLSGLWREDELAALLAEVPDADEWADGLGGLPTGDKSPFEQMTFTLATEQADAVRAAIAKAKHTGDFVETGNANSNGNALARICEAYCGGS